MRPLAAALGEKAAGSLASVALAVALLDGGPGSPLIQVIKLGLFCESYVSLLIDFFHLIMVSFHHNSFESSFPKRVQFKEKQKR